MKWSDNDNLSENLNNQNESEDQQIPAGVTDTLFTATDFLEDNEQQNILNVAPAEGNRPLSVFRDKYCEELAYPGIFLGQPRLDTEQQKDGLQCVWRIYSLRQKKLQMKILLGKCHITLRKYKGNS